MPQTTSPTKNQSPVWTWGTVADATQYHVFEDEVDKGFVTGTSYTSTNLAEGTHYLQVTALDALGNESAKSEAGYVVVDLTAPAVPEMEPLPPFTKDATLTFKWSASDTAVKYELSYSKDGGTNWTEAPNLTAQSYTLNIADVADGIAVLGKVRAYDGVGNVSEYSAAVQTIIDRTGPVVTITNPTEPVTTNAKTFTWKWTATEAGCGVDYYIVNLVVDDVDNDSWAKVAAGTSYSSELQRGKNVLLVKGVDKLGNVSAAPATAAVVTQVVPTITIVEPLPVPDAYKINEISTIAFQVIGLYDGPVEVYVKGVKLDAWRIVTVVNEPTLAKFYVLLDSEVLVPGNLAITIKVGVESKLIQYKVDSDRSGFGFGRLRLW